jgi:hypothetical protein
MPWMGFEPTIPASERERTVHVLDRAATVTGLQEGLEKNIVDVSYLGS